MGGRWQALRDVVLFVGGLAGAAHETVRLAAAGEERPTLLLLFAAMMGLPAFFRADEKRNGKDPT